MSTQPDVQLEAREQLLVTASRLMREGDTVDISLSKLSKAAGLNSALVKYYFGNKGGLMREVLVRDMRGIIAALNRLLELDIDPETKLRQHVSGVVDTFYRVPYIQRLLMQLLGESTPAEAQRLADAYLTPLYAAYDRLIGEGVAQGVFRDVDPQMFFFTLIGSADRFFAARLFLYYCFGEDPLTDELRDRYRDHAVDFIMAGLLRN